MALLNEYYIFVETEELRRGVNITEHPVESGLDITDNIKRKPIVISIKGEIVGEDAGAVMDKITALHQKGNYVKYIGRNILSKALITSFDTSHHNTIYGGCSFSMEISEVRIAKSPLTTKTASTQKQTTKTNSSKGSSSSSSASSGSSAGKKYTVKRGDTLWGIAKKYYGSGAKYTKIAEANKNLIKDPNLIKVGWVLTIP